MPEDYAAAEEKLNFRLNAASTLSANVENPMTVMEQKNQQNTLQKFKIDGKEEWQYDFPVRLKERRWFLFEKSRLLQYHLP